MPIVLIPPRQELKCNHNQDLHIPVTAYVKHSDRAITAASKEMSTM
jgi:hypothetical protein